MRTLPALMQTILDGGIFVGDRRPSSRVTVEPDWYLNLESDGCGNLEVDKRPIRWFQRADNSQLEVEVPNVLQIDLDRGIDNAAAACTIVIKNQKMRINGAPVSPGELGQPGYFTFSRGDSPESTARWGHTRNDWNHVLVPNALLRTYEGYGGHEKPLAQAIADGNVMLTGVWLVDEIRVGTDHRLQMTCRDMMKLLIEQQLYPPLIPLSRYPLDYRRWVYDNVALNAHGIDVGTVTTIEPGDRFATFTDSSVDRWYPQGSPGSQIEAGGFVLHGHRAADAFDGNDETYWLGEGNSRPDAEFAVNFIEVDAGGEAVNAIFVNPWGGNYTMYISVMENGLWQGDPNNLIHYDPSILFGTQPYAVDTGSAIPYVSAEGVPWEQAKEYILPRMYAAQRIRITFRDLTDSGIGPWRYRAGVREFRVRIGSGGVQIGSVQHLEPLFLAADMHPVSGYWTADTFGHVDAFGEARLGDPDPESTDRSTWALRSTPSGDGYFTMDDRGKVVAHGDAVHHGDLTTLGIVAATSNNQAIDMAVTPDGGGYWIIRFNGALHAFGNATNYTSSVPLTALSAAAACEGNSHGALWVLDTAGAVHAYGTASLGSYSPPLPAGTPNQVVEVATSLRRTLSGSGYWITTSQGHVQHFGDAPDLGGLAAPNPTEGDWRKTIWEIMPNPVADIGFILLRGDGTLIPIGDVGTYYGGPTSGTAILRKDGDYLDYVDIIKDLVLWSGFWLQETLDGTEEPRVYGNLESTGVYADEALPADLFDKRPVIDAINAIKEIVGYLVYVDDEGGFRFESPNWWASGNFDENGDHLDIIPEVDERVDLTNYSISAKDAPVRSQIIIASQKVDPKDSTAEYTRYIPATARMLRGLVKPAMWVNGFFTSQEEQLIMAELIALHIWFQIRTSSATAWCNPAVQVNDQVRVLERQTSETYIHYVRGKHTVNDAEKGTYTMELTTNWLGDHDSWVITSDNLAETDPQPSDGLGRFELSKRVAEWIRKGGGASRSRKAVTLYDTGTYLTQAAIPDYTDDGDRAGPE